MKKTISILLAVVLIFALSAPVYAADDKPSAAFVTFGLGGDFFQALADTFVETMEAEGWNAEYADGQFNPTAQIDAMENYIAKGVDVIVLWSVAPEAMGFVIEQAQAAGIKVVAFVAPTETYDALMLAEDAKLADSLNYLAAKWIDETFADAEDHSVPVAVFSCRTAQTGVTQADELIKIEEFSDKAMFVKEVELQDENTDTGMAAAENLYITDPEIQVFLTAHNGLALGINNYFTGLSSPVTDYSDMGIFCVNGNEETGKLIKASANGETPFRGMVLTGGVQDTCNEILTVVTGIYSGELPSGTVTNANTLFVNADTADEYLETGNVTALTIADFEEAA
ncbi:MAG: substrate-binding domain-containing protein [Oscillospiraceae bacterium]|nr:substrate-binding domain-containing protein [Oscillospiraceae bacterium]